MASFNLFSPFKFPSSSSAAAPTVSAPDAKQLPPSPERVNSSSNAAPMARPSPSPLSSKASRSTLTTDAGSTDALVSGPPSPLRSKTPVNQTLFGESRSPTRTTEKASFATAAGLPGSPSLAEFPALLLRGGGSSHHARTNSDVAGLVKRFEHLEVRDRDAELEAARRKRFEAELRRAQVGREEAESEVAKLREDNRRLKRELEDAKDREREKNRRVEVVMGEYAQAKDGHASQAAAYDKELRKARKEAFKSSSALVKAQQELNAMRANVKVLQADLDMERRRSQQREQKSFEAEYQLVAALEALETLKTEAKVAAEERDALKTRLKEDEVALIAASGLIALPASNRPGDDEDLLSSPAKFSPRKRAASPLSDDKENAGEMTKKVVEARRLQEELARERSRRLHHEEMAEFLRLECQFQCCGCRSSRKPSHDTVLALSDELMKSMESIRKEMSGILATVHQPNVAEITPAPELPLPDDGMEDDSGPVIEHPAPEVDMIVDLENPIALPEASRSTTMIALSPEHHHRVSNSLSDEGVAQDPHQATTDAELYESEISPVQPRPATSVALQPLSPRSPPQAYQTTPFRHQPAVRTVTTTTTVPIQFSPVKPLSRSLDEDAENIPPADETDCAIEVVSDTSPKDPSSETPATRAFDREAALAAIAYRRGRAKSIADGNATPRKQMLEGVGMAAQGGRRDISAPAIGHKKHESVPSATRGAPASVSRAIGRRMG